MLLEIENISKSFTGFPYKRVQVLSNVSLAVSEGDSLGLVGESGSGKSTIIKCLFQLIRPDSGRITYDGIDVGTMSGADLKRFRREVQLVFQDPYSSLNPRMTAEQLISEGLVVHEPECSAAKRRDRVGEMMEMVGLPASDMVRYPHTFSGGQRQRLAIARALVMRPRLLVCDEPVSALDVSVQAQVINLLRSMQKQLRLTLLFVAHDLAIVRHMCERIAVLHAGHVVECGTREEVFNASQHAYTRSLLQAVPIPDPVVARRRT